MNKRFASQLLIIIVAFAVWGTALWNGFVWDDRILIQKNQGQLSSISILGAFSGDFWSTDTETGTSNYYRPLVTLSYMLDYAVWGLSPAGYHLTNLFIHIGCILLLFSLLTSVGASLSAATSSALIWGVHPALAESVAWISGRTDSLATLFIFASIRLALMALKSDRLSSRYWLISASLCGAALLSKESGIVTPLLILIFARCAGGAQKFALRIVLLFGGITGLWVILRAVVLDQIVGVEARQGISTSMGILSLLHIWGGILWPFSLRIEYSSSITGAILLGGAALGAMLLIGLCDLATRAGTERLIRYVIIAAGVAFIPSALAVLLKSMIGVRLVYTASAFAIAGLVIAIERAFLQRRLIFQRSTAIVIFILGAISIHRAQLWRSDITLFSAALEAPAPSTRNHLNLGIGLYDIGDFEGAMRHLSIDMDREALDQRHYMLALIDLSLGCEGLAESNFKQALDWNPNNYSAAHNLAALLATQGRNEDALSALRQVAARSPDLAKRAAAQIRVLQGVSLGTKRDPKEAQWCSDKQALRSIFASPLTLNRLAGDQLRNRQVDMAEPLILAALRAEPWFVPARLNKAQLALLRNDVDAARTVLESILITHPAEERALKLLKELSADRPSGGAR